MIDVIIRTEFKLVITLVGSSNLDGDWNDLALCVVPYDGPSREEASRSFVRLDGLIESN